MIGRMMILTEQIELILIYVAWWFGSITLAFALGKIYDYIKSRLSVGSDKTAKEKSNTPRLY